MNRRTPLCRQRFEPGTAACTKTHVARHGTLTAKKGTHVAKHGTHVAKHGTHVAKHGTHVAKHRTHIARNGTQFAKHGTHLAKNETRSKFTGCTWKKNKQRWPCSLTKQKAKPLPVLPATQSKERLKRDKIEIFLICASMNLIFDLTACHVITYKSMPKTTYDSL